VILDRLVPRLVRHAAAATGNGTVLSTALTYCSCVSIARWPLCPAAHAPAPLLSFRLMPMALALAGSPPSLVWCEIRCRGRGRSCRDAECGGGGFAAAGRVSIVWCSMPRRVGAVHGCMRATRSQLDGRLIRLNSRVFLWASLLLLPSVVCCLYA
jgi:hypothetical protein